MLNIGVIEWGSDFIEVPSVFVGTPDEIMHWAGRTIQNYTFDDGGEIDQHRDTYHGGMTYEEVTAWYEELWEYTTDAWVGIYELQGAEGRAECLGRGDA